MKKNKIKINSYEDMLENYYGNFHKQHKKKKDDGKMVLTKSFDTGEILVQSPEGRNYEEYVVQSSVDDGKFEEYVIENADWSKQSSEEIRYEMVPTETDSPREYGMEVTDPLQDSGATQPDSMDKIDQLFAGVKSLDTPYPAEPVKRSANEDDFIADMQSILSGQAAYDPAQKKTVPAAPRSNPQPDPLPNENEQTKIFNRIAQSMQYANAYDMGTVELQNRFAEFDKIYDEKNSFAGKKKSEPQQSPQQSSQKSPSQPVSDDRDLKVGAMEFIQDLDEIRKQRKLPDLLDATPDAAFAGDKDDASKTMSEAVTSDAPPRPSNIRMYTPEEKIQSFGSIQYEADPNSFNGDGIKILSDWQEKNIVPVSIPQLNGKKMGGQTITNGIILFNKVGVEQLKNLWKAWETAGLLNKVLSFDGAFAPRFAEYSKDRNPRPLSNHAYGIAFDINTQWNPCGKAPANAGQEGSVRELVAIANQNGFYWGGHFESRPEGKQFVLGKLLN